MSDEDNLNKINSAAKFLYQYSLVSLSGLNAIKIRNAHIPCFNPQAVWNSLRRRFLANEWRWGSTVTRSIRKLKKKKKTFIIQRVPSLILYDDLHVEILVLLYKIGSPLYKVYSKLRLPVINMTKIMFIFFTNLVHPRCCPESSVNRGLQIDSPLLGAHQRRHLAPSEPTIQLPSLWTLDDVVGYFFHVFDARISNRVI